MSGLHPDSQRLLWAMVYNRRQEFLNKKPWRQLEQRGLIRRIGTVYMGGEQWEVTPLGVAELQTYAPFLKRIGLQCPPND
ncbi:hypothetical protein [Paraburkholderia hospita]|uniref:hypothetical protein n=1 Tax=Paraburkholderia hospita TaxID=169430 RepID=UPI000B345AF2|nr:hypothetical protein [Paraburkholderia hospita]OUL89858.1 hypothetical protein CA603_18160 [Paraburkholderia hospita]